MAPEQWPWLHALAMVPANDACRYLGTKDGHWRGMPSTALTLPVQARISVMKQLAGIDVQAMYPARPEKRRCLTAGPGMLT